METYQQTDATSCDGAIRDPGPVLSLPAVLAVLLALVHFLFVMRFYEPAISTRDANAYYTQARLIATTGKTSFTTESLLQYVDRNWLYAPDGRYYSKNPPGFPALLAVTYRVFGPGGALWLNPVLASLSLLLIFLVCRLVVGNWWGLLAAIFLAMNPFANEHVHYAGSHTITIFFMLTGLYFVLSWTRTRAARWLFLAGLFLGAIPTFRYPEVLFLPAIALFVALQSGSEKGARGRLKTIAVFCAGAAVFLLPLSVRNQLVFGAFWKTGYAMAGEQAMFGLGYFKMHALQYLHRLLSDGGAHTFVLGVTGIAYLCTRKDSWKYGVLLAALAVPLTVAYMSYYVPPYIHIMRFLLPVFPVLIIGTVWLLRLLTQNRRAAAITVSAVVLLLTACWGVPRSVYSMQLIQYNQGALAELTRMLEEKVEPGSLIIADEDVSRHLDYVGKWRIAEANALFLRGKQQQIQLAYVPETPPPGKAAAQFDRYNSLKGAALFQAFATDVWNWSNNVGQQPDQEKEPIKVYWLARDKNLNRFMNMLKRTGRFEQVAELDYNKTYTEQNPASPLFRPHDPQATNSDWILGRSIYIQDKAPLKLYAWTPPEQRK